MNARVRKTFVLLAASAIGAGRVGAETRFTYKLVPMEDAVALNDAGAVAGMDDERAVVYAEGRLSYLPDLPGCFMSRAVGIDNDGNVAGSANEKYSRDKPDKHEHAVRWSGGKAVDIGGADADAETKVTWVSSDGHLLGTKTAGFGSSTPVTFDAGKPEPVVVENGGMITARNGKGTVVGNHKTSDDAKAYTAFASIDGKVTDLGMLPGSKSSRAIAVNEKGDIIGSSFDSEMQLSAASTGFFFHDGKLTSLGTLKGHESTPVAINEAGSIVGVSDSLPFLYSDGKMVDLNTLVDGADKPVFLAARDINNKGQILVDGVLHGGKGEYLLTPVAAESSKS